MANPVLIFLLIVALVVVAYLSWRLARVRRVISTLGAAVRRKEEFALLAGEPGPEPSYLRQLIAVLGEELEKNEAVTRAAEEGRAFHDVLAEMSLGVLIVNGEMGIEFANPVAARLFSATESPVGRPLIEVCRDHRFVAVAREAVDSGRRASREINTPSPGHGDGDLPDRVHEIEAAPLRPAGPRERLCWIIVRDVTAEVMTEQVRKDFVANASHELRTPLTMINGYLETLEDGLIDDREAAMKSVGIMRKHGQRLGRIIEDMLTISKLESSANTLRLEPFDVVECGTDVISHLAPAIEEREAIVEFDVPEGDRSMTGDRFYWDQILLNLIENALKENQRHGLHVTVSFEKTGDNNVIKVRDDGVGIQRTDLPFIFKRFFRGAKHHSQHEIKGTGLGLSIVKRAVEAHGGNISVESTPGKETVFTLTVPIEVTAVVEKS